MNCYCRHPDELQIGAGQENMCRTRNGQAYIAHLYYELSASGVGEFRLAIRYGETEACAIILVVPPKDENIQDQIVSLSEALKRGARSPMLFSYPKKPQ
jgi:hypothetical protein